VPRVGITPGAIGICEIDLNAVDGFGFILFFRLEDELLEDRIITGDDAAAIESTEIGGSHVFGAYLMDSISYPLLFLPRLTRSQCPR
jgi:hypothetical protein